MGAKQQSVQLPKHLWAALDDMSRDGAQPADALMEMAVETFVALQGYEVPVAERGVAPSPITTEKPEQKPTGKAQSLQDDDEDVGLARTMARSALVPEMKPQEEPPPGATDMGPAHKVGAQPPNITGIAPTHVPVAKRAPEPAAPAPAPAPVAAPPSGKTKPPQEAVRAPVEPAWLKRPALMDSDEERAAARERLVAIDADVEKLTIERPTTNPLGAAEDE